ncbi:MAG: SRPBCC family protein [Acidimicrobiia bacterium]
MSEPIVVERRIAAPPASVYAYLTDADKWIRWQGVGATLDPRKGGIFSLSMPNGANARGEFVELIPDAKVVFTWGWLDHPGVPPGSSIVEIDLAPDGTGTLLTLTHRELPEDEVPVHTEGWNLYLPRLAAVVVGEEIDPDSL